MKIISTGPEIVREAIIAAAGAALAALVVRAPPVDWQRLFSLPRRE